MTVTAAGRGLADDACAGSSTTLWILAGAACAAGVLLGVPQHAGIHGLDAGAVAMLLLIALLVVVGVTIKRRARWRGTGAAGRAPVCGSAIGGVPAFVLPRCWSCSPCGGSRTRRRVGRRAQRRDQRLVHRALRLVRRAAAVPARTMPATGCAGWWRRSSALVWLRLILVDAGVGGRGRPTAWLCTRACSPDAAACWRLSPACRLIAPLDYGSAGVPASLPPTVDRARRSSVAEAGFVRDWRGLIGFSLALQLASIPSALARLKRAAARDHQAERRAVRLKARRSRAPRPTSCPTRCARAKQASARA